MDIATNHSETVDEPIRFGDGKPRKVDASRRKRSAVTNGTKAFLDGDGNSPWYRRYKDLASAHAVDLGGADHLSEAQLSLCRRAATMEVELERIEGQLSLGRDSDLDVYSRISSSLRRILESLGLERVARPVDDGSTVLFDHFSRPPTTGGRT
jgi:hypothetical protein